MEKQIAREHFAFARQQKRFPREHFAFAREQKRFPLMFTSEEPTRFGIGCYLSRMARLPRSY